MQVIHRIERCLLAIFSHFQQKTESNELISWKQEKSIQRISWMCETKLFVIESHILLIELNIETEQRDSSSNHLLLKAIETNGRQTWMRPRQTFQTLRQCFVSCSIDFDWCCIIDPEQCQTKRTSSKTRPIPKHTKQSKKTLMNIEKKYLNRFQFHSKMNSCCLKWCQICKSSWICE